MNYKFSVVFMSIFCLSSCATKNQEDKERGNFQHEREAHAEAVNPGIVMRIEDMHVADSVLICQSGGTGFHFYRFLTKDFTLLDSVGANGVGPDEFMSPRLVMGDKYGRVGIIDNSKLKYTILKGDGSSTALDLPAVAMNEPVALEKAEMIVYAQYHPMHISLDMYDASTGLAHELLKYEDDSGDAMQYDFAWDLNDDRLVWVHLHKDIFGTATIDEEGQLQSTCISNEDAPIDKSRYLYTDVAAGDEYVYMLSAKRLDQSSWDGGSEVEIYTYDFKPVARITLDRPMGMMKLDKANRRLLFTSYDDDCIYYLNLADNEL